MYVVDICKVAYIMFRAFVYIISFHFILKNIPSKSSDPFYILHDTHFKLKAMKTETQNDVCEGFWKQIYFKLLTYVCILYSLSLRIPWEQGWRGGQFI